jgi:hypothetical protein
LAHADQDDELASSVLKNSRAAACWPPWNFRAVRVFPLPGCLPQCGIADAELRSVVCTQNRPVDLGDDARFAAVLKKMQLPE